MDFQVWDFPGQLDYFDPAFDATEIFSDIGALVWVIDAQDDYTDSVTRLTASVANLQDIYPNINVEVFVHKMDGLSDEYKADAYQDIRQRIEDELNDHGFKNPPVSYHQTSIYDYSVFEAFSKVIQKLVPQLGTLENLLNILVNNSGMEKAYLFDTISKIYVGSDTRPIDMEIYEMCSDYIDVILDISELYSYSRQEPVDDNGGGGGTAIGALGPQMDETESSVTIHDGSMIYLKEMNKLVSIEGENFPLFVVVLAFSSADRSFVSSGSPMLIVSNFKFGSLDTSASSPSSNKPTPRIKRVCWTIMLISFRTP